MAREDIAVYITAKDHYSKAMVGMQQVAHDTGKSFKKLGSSANSLKGALVGVGAIHVFNSLVTQAEDFQVALSDLPKVTDRSLSLIRADVLSINSALGSTTELTKGYYEVMSAGVTNPLKAMELLKTAAKASKGAHVDLGETIEAMTKLMEGYGGSIESATEASDILFAIEEVGQTKFAALVPVIGGLATMSNQLRIESHELGGALAQLSLTAGDTNKASTQYEATLTALMKPSEAMKELYEKMEVASGEAAIESMGFVNVLREVQNATGGSSVKLGELLSSKEAIKGFSALAIDNFSGMEERIIAVGTAAGGTSDAFKEWSSTSRSESEILKNDLEKKAIEMESSLLTVKSAAMSAGSSILTYFDQVGKGLGILVAKMVTPEIVDPLEEINKEIEAMGSSEAMKGPFQLYHWEEKMQKLLFKRAALMKIEKANINARTDAIVKDIQAEKKREELKAKTAEGSKGLIKVNEKVAEALNKIELATIKGMATKAELAAMDAAEFRAMGANEEQVRRYMAAKTELSAFEDAEATKKAARQQLKSLEAKDPFEALGNDMSGMSDFDRRQLEHEQKMEQLRNHASQVLMLMQEETGKEVEVARLGAEYKMLYAQEQADFDMEMAEMSAQSKLGVGQKLLAIGMQHSKKSFKTHQAFGTAQAIMDTYMGVNKALGSAPPPLNFALAASVMASGMATVSKLKSTKPGGGGGGSIGGGSGSGGGMAPRRTPDMPIARPEAIEKGAQQISITIHNPLSGENWEAIGEDIIASINKAGERNVELDIRNAAERD